MTNPTDSLNQLALNKAVQCYMEYPGRAEIRPLVTAIIEAYLRCGEILDNTITDGVRPEQESSPVEVAQNGDNVSPSSRQPVDSPMELLKLLGYVNAMIGYCQSLKVGTVITDGYMQRMNDHYIPNTQKACMLIAGLLDKAQAPVRESIDLEAGARSCARWRNGRRLAYPDFDALTDIEKAAYRDQAKGCIESALNTRIEARISQKP